MLLLRCCYELFWKFLPRERVKRYMMKEWEKDAMLMRWAAVGCLTPMPSPPPPPLFLPSFSLSSFLSSLSLIYFSCWYAMFLALPIFLLFLGRKGGGEREMLSSQSLSLPCSHLHLFPPPPPNQPTTPFPVPACRLVNVQFFFKEKVFKKSIYMQQKECFPGRGTKIIMPWSLPLP